MESVYSQPSATSWQILWTVERTGLWNNSSEANTCGQGSSFSHLPAAALWQLAWQPGSQKKKTLLKFTRQKSNWELIIKMYLASGTSLISYILLYSSPFQNSKTMPQVPGPNYLPAKEREQQREREHSAAVLRDRKAWYNSWIPARPHGDPWPASLLSASIASVDGASTALQIRPK